MPNPLRTALSVLDAGDQLGLSRQAVVFLIESGQLPSHFEGWTRRVLISDIEAFDGKRDCHRSIEVEQGSA
ncbi:helix-turn-helix domain-containing protein [Sphingopyxis macrogoltabida]|uniref:helix-turn-helix domain-containing protein n=1 Tax=Sphingopyxis macrogoltabida TaxID=33050 RepID=UPI000B187695|nr:helix-turn-helix domain-containing protein [Sphingopyxis macrogoltabida]